MLDEHTSRGSATISRPRGGARGARRRARDRSAAQRSPLTVLHLIHETSFGGVEAAAENLRRTFGSGRPASSAQTDLHYRVAALEASADDTAVVRPDIAGRSVNSPLSALRLLREVRREKPDVLITSLWRAVALGPLAKMLSPHTRWAIWVHLPRYTHRLDRLVHHWCLPRADMVLSDAEATYRTLVQGELASAGRSVPHRVVRPAAGTLALEHEAAPPAASERLRLVYWGRMARQKRLDLAIDLVDEIGRQHPGGAELLIIGPDAGQHEALLAHTSRLGLTDRVRFEPPMDREGLAREAKNAHAFVQLSDAEGFAMSAHEAIAAGMVSVLTPVGELAADTEDGTNCLHHHGDLTVTARRLVELIGDPEAFARMARTARDSAGDDFLLAFSDACRALVPEHS